QVVAEDASHAEVGVDALAIGHRGFGGVGVKGTDSGSWLPLGGGLLPEHRAVGGTETIDLPFINGIRRLPEPAVLAAAALPEAALAEAGGGLGLLCRDGRGDEHLVAPDDGRGPGVAGNLGLPGDVLVGGPFDGQLFGRTGGRAVRPAKLRPLVAA